MEDAGQRALEIKSPLLKEEIHPGHWQLMLPLLFCQCASILIGENHF